MKALKKNMLICAPATSRSGYGDHARDIIWSFLEHDKYNILILDVPWGDCSRDALHKDNKKHAKILEKVVPINYQLQEQPDIYVDIRIPNEFQQVGKFNIGITAGVETNAVSQKWIESCNKMDLIIVPSEHSKQGFINTLYDKVQQLPNGEQQKIGELKLEKPIEIVFEGSDGDIYKPIDDASLDLVDDIKEDFGFLFVGMWGNGALGEDRKDIGTLVKTFYEAFANKEKQPFLILKTSGATFSIIDKELCLKRINDIKNLFPSDWKLPSVYLLHGDLVEEEMNKLYNHPKVKVMASFTHGEGYGRPLQEATMVGLPVVTTGWSGHTDFLNSEDSILIPGELGQIPESVVWGDILISQSKWFNIDVNAAYKALNEIFFQYDYWLEKSKSLMEKNRSTLTLDKMTEYLDIIMQKYLKDQPSAVKLKLPKLKKVKETV